MTIPVLINFQGVQSSAALRAEILRRAGGLDQLEPSAIGCSVMIEAIRLPGSDSERYCVSARLVLADSDLDEPVPIRDVFTHQDPYAAVRETFNALCTQIAGPTWMPDHDDPAPRPVPPSSLH